MPTRHLEFYIDESGSFEDTASGGKPYSQMSLVGGILYAPEMLTDKRLAELLPERVHCCEYYDKERYLGALEALHHDGAKFVIFQNRERILVLDGDRTYLNILCEGLLQLLTNLKLEYPDEQVKLNVVIATRKNVSAGTGYIHPEEYYPRLKEKLELAKYRSHADICDYELHFADARYSKRHDLADIVCNTYLTQNGKKKFTDADRQRIAAVYDKKYIYSVFESATVAYIKQLLSENRCSEMIYQICALPNLQGVTDLHEILLERLNKANSLERNTYFQEASLQIGLYVANRMFTTGIQFATNYQNYILRRLQSSANQQHDVDFWMFDTNFYILTMYNHLGAVSKCSEYLKACNESIHVINHSWEHIDYYFKFKIRELNCLKGQFAFDEVIEKSNQLIKILTDAKDLFGLIETYDQTNSELKSELLGKAYGVQLEAYTNLVLRQPDLLSTALSASDHALAEFSSSDDLQHQYQSRCSLMLAAGKPEEALSCLLQSYRMSATDDDGLAAFAAKIYKRPEKADIFTLWHYTSVMLLLAQHENPLEQAMFRALKQVAAADFANTDADAQGGRYPRNMILWNMSRYHQLKGESRLAADYWKRAFTMTRTNPAQITMYSFSISMLADEQAWKWHNHQLSAEKAVAAIRSEIESFCKRDIPESIRQHYQAALGDAPDKLLSYYTNAYLR